MTIDRFLELFVGNLEQIIGWSAVVIFSGAIFLLVRNIFFRATDEVPTNVGELETTLKKILDQTKTKPEKAIPQVIVDPEAAGVAEEAKKMAQMSSEQLAQAREELDSLQATLAEKEKELEALKSQPAAPEQQPASNEQSDAALKTRIQELEGKLLEYEIIEEDIADLSFYKEENAKMRRELEEMKGRAGMPTQPATPAAETPPPKTQATETESEVPVEGGEVAPAREEQPKAPEKKIEETAKEPEKEPIKEPAEESAKQAAPQGDYVTDDLMAEFAKAVAEQKKAEKPSKVREKAEAAQAASGDAETAPATPPPEENSADEVIVEAMPADVIRPEQFQGKADDLIAEFSKAVDDQLKATQELAEKKEDIPVEAVKESGPEEMSMDEFAAAVEEQLAKSAEVGPAQESLENELEQLSKEAVAEKPQPQAQPQPKPEEVKKEAKVQDVKIEVKAPEQKPQQAKAQEQKPPEQKAPEQKAQEVKPKEQRAAEAKPAEVKPAPTQTAPAAQPPAAAKKPAASLIAETEQPPVQSEVDELLSQIKENKEPTKKEGEPKKSALKRASSKPASKEDLLKKNRRNVIELDQIDTISMIIEVEGVTDDIMAEFTADPEEVGAEHEMLERFAEKVAVQDKKKAKEGADLDGELNMDKMLEEVDDLNKIDESTGDKKEFLLDQIDTDKLLTEAEGLKNDS